MERHADTRRYTQKPFKRSNVQERIPLNQKNYSNQENETIRRREAALLLYESEKRTRVACIAGMVAGLVTISAGGGGDAPRLVISGLFGFGSLAWCGYLAFSAQKALTYLNEKYGFEEKTKKGESN